MGCFGGPSIPQPAYQPPFQMPDFPEMEPMSFEFPATTFPEFPKPFDVAGEEAKKRKAEEEAKLHDIEQRRKGYSSTLLTGGRGDETMPALRKPSLLGS